MPLPHVSVLRAFYPDYEKFPQSSGVKQLIGGEALEHDVTNTCAMRMCHAMNVTGTLVPRTWDRIVNRRGANGRWYILRVANLRTWMQHAFGPPEIDVRKDVGRPFDRALIQGVPGVIAFDIKFPDATGHFDLWYGDRFSGEAIAGRDYFSSATRVSLWTGGTRVSVARP